MIYINLGLVELPVSPVLVLISAIIGVIVTFIVEKNNKGRASGAILIVLLEGLSTWSVHKFIGACHIFTQRIQAQMKM